MRKHLTLCAVATALLMTASTVFAEIKIGVLASKGAETVRSEWTELGEHLSKTLGQKVSFEAVAFDDVTAFCKSNLDQFVLVNPWQFVKVKTRFDATPIVTVNEKNVGTSFGGVLFARKDSGITRVQDIRGKSLICVKFNSAGGWLFQKAILLRARVHPETECSSLVEAGSHDDAVFAVGDRRADVGAVRTGTLELLHAAGKIDINDFVVLNPTKNENISVACSTPLYPNWPIAKLAHTPPSVADALKAALLAIPKGHAAFTHSQISSFEGPSGYKAYEDLADFLKSAGHSIVSATH